MELSELNARICEAFSGDGKAGAAVTGWRSSKS